MPYINPEEQKKYQAEWYQRKKLGLPTKTKNPKTDEHKRQVKLRCNRRYEAHKKQIITDTFSDKCFFCGYRGMLLHRKDGKKHKLPSEIGIKEMKETIIKNKNDYVFLCMTCHKAVHWIMTRMGLTWDKILSLQKPRGRKFESFT